MRITTGKSPSDLCARGKRPDRPHFGGRYRDTVRSVSTRATTTDEMKIFRCEITKTVEVAIVAANLAEAQRLARDRADEMIEGYTPHIDVGGVREMDEAVAARVFGYHIPYTPNDDEINPRDLTVAELIKEGPATMPPDENVGPVRWCDGCGYERVQFDWRELRQLCRECKERESQEAA